MSQFQPGDFVYLKSGGPAMTIRRESEGEEYYCEWFIDNRELTGTYFLSTSLTKDNPNKPKPPLAG